MSDAEGRQGPYLEVVWSLPALARLREIRAFVAEDKPDAAERLATRIVAVVGALRLIPTSVEPGLSRVRASW